MIERLNKILQLICAVLVVGMGIAIFANVSFRLIPVSISGVTEYSTYALIAITFIYAPVLLYNNEQLSVDIIYNRLSGRWKKLNDGVIHSVRIITLVFISWVGFEWIFGAEFIQRTDALDISLFWIYLIVPIGVSIMLVYELIKLKSYLGDNHV